VKADVDKAGVRWTAVRHLRRSDSDDGKADEHRESARNPSFSAKMKEEPFSGVRTSPRSSY